MTAERRRRQAFGRQLIGWIAAYAFVLHAVVAGAVATQLASQPAAFEICLDHPDGAGGPADARHQHENCAIHCAAFAGLAALAVVLFALLIPARTVRRAPHFAFHAPPDFLRRAGRSRAPPLPA